ncbi:MAG: HAMP domain-containing histidine kinase [Ruminococcaceae bacterium]|jgi:signal transduction histidine kinase|nr:HAMP domain-containing histidine kinase [Oscillospiraceae bacterium]
MRELRNPDFCRELGAYAAVTLAAAIAGWMAVSWPGVVAALLSGAVFILLHAVFTGRRYRAIAELNGQIDRILHGQEILAIGHSDEGELAILRSEIGKMTLRLKENAAALQADKLYLTRAMEDIFHQLRTPLTTMNLQLSLLAAEELSYERRMELVRGMRRQLEHISWLVETLLKMSQLDAGTAPLHRDDISVRELALRAAEPLVIPMELRGQTLQIDVREERLTADLLWTAEAIGNLLKNCMEHTPAGGTVTLTAEETAIYTQLTVQDTGPGFEAADIPHLFERFYRGGNAGEGSIGIGLAMSRLVIASQDGTITAANAPGGGAQFTIRFYKSVV